MPSGSQNTCSVDGRFITVLLSLGGERACGVPVPLGDFMGGTPFEKGVPVPLCAREAGITLALLWQRVRPSTVGSMTQGGWKGVKLVVPVASPVRTSRVSLSSLLCALRSALCPLHPSLR